MAQNLERKLFSKFKENIQTFQDVWNQDLNPFEPISSFSGEKIKEKIQPISSSFGEKITSSKELTNRVIDFHLIISENHLKLSWLLPSLVQDNNLPFLSLTTSLIITAMRQDPVFAPTQTLSKQ